MAIRLEIKLLSLNLLSSVRFMTNSQAIAANSEPIRRLATGKAESPARPFDPGSFLVLVVDDVSQNVRLSIEMLDQAGYETTFAMTGAEALMRVRSAQPDLILLDLMMPGMSGLQLCDRLKEDPILRDIPVLFVTASNEETHMLEAFQLGAVDYITKPFRSAELLARVRVHLELKQARDRLSQALNALQRTHAQLQSAYTELGRLATTDPLTGLANRRHWMTLAKKEFQRSCRYQHPLSVLMLDLDHFKAVNDTYGHAVGDLALATATQAASSILRTQDCLGRYGGEEFVMLLPETDAAAAAIVAERIRKAIADPTITSLPSAPGLTLTVSIGGTSCQSTDTSIEAALNRADRALYQAKNRGRNRVMMVL